MSFTDENANIRLTAGKMIENVQKREMLFKNVFDINVRTFSATQFFETPLFVWIFRTIHEESQEILN